MPTHTYDDPVADRDLPRLAVPIAGLWPGADRIAAAVTLIALGLRQQLHTEVTSGYALALLLVPIWIRTLRQFGGARVFLGVGLLAAVWGVLLSQLDVPRHLVSTVDRNNSLAILLGTLAGIGVVLWARTLMGLASVAGWYGLGMCLGAGAGFTAAAGNAWKFVWAVPAAILVLALAARTGRRWVELAGLAGLALMSAATGSRSYLASFALAGLLLAWQSRPRAGERRASWVVNAAALVAAGWATYFLGSTLLVSGYLGTQAQARSIAQIRQSGSLILGGRPELSATFGLMRDHFEGFGPGAIPTQHDVIVAKSAMKNIGYAPNNGYVDKFMFGGHIELHSMIGDLWANYGLVGLAMIGLIVGVIVRGLSSALAHRNASAVLIFACIWTLWNVGFSPLYAAEPTLLLTIGLVLLPRRVATAEPAA